MLKCIFILSIDEKIFVLCSFVELNEFFFECMFNIRERGREEKEEEWVGDEIDAMMDNILFFFSPSRERKFVGRKKKRTLNTNFNVVFICTFLSAINTI
jgi:hypothetical protein